MQQLDASYSASAQSRALSVNSSDTVIGGWNTLTTDPAVFPDGFVWNASTGFLNLVDQLASGSGWLQVTPYGINDSGNIAGQGTKTVTGYLHAFVMTPSAGPSIPGQSKLPFGGDPDAVPALAPTAPPPSGLPNISPPGVDLLNAPARLPLVPDASAATTVPGEAASATSPAFQEQFSRDLVFAGSGVELIGLSGACQNGLDTGPWE
jgi:hypothetical protein